MENQFMMSRRRFFVLLLSATGLGCLGNPPKQKTMYDEKPKYLPPYSGVEITLEDFRNFVREYRSKCGSFTTAELREKVLSEYDGANWTQQELDLFDRISREIKQTPNPYLTPESGEKKVDILRRFDNLTNSTKRVKSASEKVLDCELKLNKIDALDAYNTDPKNYEESPNGQIDEGIVGNPEYQQQLVEDMQNR